MPSLLPFLESRLMQLEQRKMMIPRYVEMPGNSLGKKDFSLDDIPKIERDIEETEVAIDAIKQLRKNKKL